MSKKIFLQASLLLLSLPLLTLTSCSPVEDPSLIPNPELLNNTAIPAKKHIPYSETRTVFWGDLHIHTSLSFDAYTMGTRTLPDDAYRYMKGGTIAHGAGYSIRAQRPLDFGAVTDHAEFLGVPRYLAGDKVNKSDLPDVLASGNPLRISWNLLTAMKVGSTKSRQKNFGKPGMEKVSNAAWHQIIEAAEQHNDPGRFTTFIAYEWSSMPNEQNLHRNVIYKTSQVPDYPYSSLISDNPEDLWSALEAQRKKGIEVFAIPHNGNASNGLMYDSKTFTGKKLDANYARRRTRNEPLSEIFQIKGSSETHPSLSPNDRFAGHEIMDKILASSVKSVGHFRRRQLPKSVI